MKKVFEQFKGYLDFKRLDFHRIKNNLNAFREFEKAVQNNQFDEFKKWVDFFERKDCYDVLKPAGLTTVLKADNAPMYLYLKELGYSSADFHPPKFPHKYPKDYNFEEANKNDPSPECWKIIRSDRENFNILGALIKNYPEEVEYINFAGKDLLVSKIHKVELVKFLLDNHPYTQSFLENRLQMVEDTQNKKTWLNLSDIKVSESCELLKQKIRELQLKSDHQNLTDMMEQKPLSQVTKKANVL